MGPESLLEEVSVELERNILPFWLSLKDPAGGYYGEVSPEGTVIKDAPRGGILNARIIWSFAAAYGALGKPEYLQAALLARNWFADCLLDHGHGGVFWSVTADGKPLEVKKQLYSQAFAIYAFSELYKVSSDPEDLKVAVDLFHLVEKEFADPIHGGYVEALSRDFSPLEDKSLSARDINAGKTMNSHLHLLEAYANLFSVWPDPSLKVSLVALTTLMCERIISPSGHLHLYFSDDWTVIPGAVSYGHDIETSWLLLECAEAAGDPSLAEYVKPFCAVLGKAAVEGLVPDGSMAYELHPDGRKDIFREWWVQAETVVGNLWLWKYHSDPEGLPRALSCWTWIKDHLPCRSGSAEGSQGGGSLPGEWYWGINPDGTPDLSRPRAGFWKCPYHNTRMCLEVMKIVK